MPMHGGCEWRGVGGHPSLRGCLRSSFLWPPRAQGLSHRVVEPYMLHYSGAPYQVGSARRELRRWLLELCGSMQDPRAVSILGHYI